jgi:hypothetical protein
MNNFTSNFLKVNGINLHFLHYPNEGKKVLVLLHGLTANCFGFSGLVSNGLTENFELVIPDLRGRGKSSRPAFGYSFKKHADDILGLLKHFKEREIILVGYSFGGLLSSYLCYFHESIFKKIVFLDAAPDMNPKMPIMLETSIGRIGKVYNNQEDYFNQIKQAPFNDFWDNDMESYYSADIKTNENGTVESKSNLAQIIQIATYIIKEPFTLYFKSINHPSLLISGNGVYNLNEAILPSQLAAKAVGLLKNGKLFSVNGNHHSMLYGEYAKQVVEQINEFVT